MAPTLTQVAQRAGVSLSTASRAFSNPDRIGADTLARIIAVADQIGYVAASGRSSDTRVSATTVAVVVPDIGHTVFASFVKSAQAQGWHRRQTIVLTDTDGSADREREVIGDLQGRVDALIVCAPRLPAEDIVQLAGDTPLVLVNRSSSECDCVVADSEDGIRQAVDYLAALGHTHLAYVQGSPQSWSNERRVDAVEQFCAARGIVLDVLGWQQETLAGGHAAAASVVATGATAVMTHNDPMAIGVMNGVRSMGLAVPEDLSVIGIDDSPLAELAHPALTSINVPMGRAGLVSSDLVFQRAAEPESSARTIHLPTQLVVRGSSGPARIRTLAPGKDDSK
ncbi:MULTISPECIES: LacI family DNA-binding transcriptional regulator [Nocardiaceae]|uniref:LacI family DNA-binding transcriptional regulator n=1 Tax=Nocardiaceae TaxID=85025 RepID=UPI00050C67A3|nr:MULTISPECIES: LacI family DNA-binding transcriptional regulator [Rhodococcus]NIL84593.1 HTH-type transcriptional regulator DegA [Rhodococcus fascians]OZD55137.1 LacI family transcriptional regulator [Rhodococcus sp. 06-1477-1B]RZL81406.1 MAG: LacI family transcriptional regulator [Rhodococcus sp. (in: high G+C Gram-positive bacteria)]OZD00309.1 LacI family transcriptional regulator [Rhodococcus sp. 06-221-2]OZD46804.1 LacI family transcriptional regulator [Rhodococcus sp. 06-1474-1B]